MTRHGILVSSVRVPRAVETSGWVHAQPRRVGFILAFTLAPIGAMLMADIKALKRIGVFAFLHFLAVKVVASFRQAHTAGLSLACVRFEADETLIECGRYLRVCMHSLTRTMAECLLCEKPTPKHLLGHLVVSLCQSPVRPPKARL